MNLKRYLPMLAALAVVMVTLTGGIAAGQTDPTPTPTPDSETAELPQSQTFSDVDNDTESLRVVAMSTTGPLDVSVEATYENGTTTEVATGTLDTSGDSTVDSDTFTYGIEDSQTHPEYNVTVSDGSADGSTATAESVEIEKLQAMSGGGGLLPGGAADLSGGMILGIVLALLALAGLLMVVRG